MDQTKVANEILIILYNSFFLSESNPNLKRLAEQQGWEATTFWNLVNKMSQEGLIESAGLGGVYKIAAPGVLHAEETRIVAEDLVKTNRKARMQILLALAKVYEEQGSLYSVQNSELYRQTGLDQTQATANLLVLHGLHFTERFGNGGSRLTSRGHYEVERERNYRYIVNEFESLSDLKPQPRGRALQQLIAKIVEIYGWSQEESVKTSNEEMDVIVFREREYYLLESKWEKDRIEAPVIRELIGKLENRIDVRGIVVSMSGFTRGALEQVHDHTGKRIILLFGNDDVRALVYGQETFDDLLNAKYKALVTKRRVDFK